MADLVAVNANAVLDELVRQLGQALRENAILRVQVAELQKQPEAATTVNKPT